jgi:hypothetical protein
MPTASADGHDNPTLDYNEDVAPDVLTDNRPINLTNFIILHRLGKSSSC